MPRRISLWADTVDLAGGRATIRGEVWLGPVEVGDWFIASTTATDEEAVRLQLQEITAPPEAQEVGRVPRVIAVLAGEGIESVRPGVVLIGEVDRD